MSRVKVVPDTRSRTNARRMSVPTLPTTGNLFSELGLRSMNAAAGVKHVWIVSEMVCLRGSGKNSISIYNLIVSHCMYLAVLILLYEACTACLPSP